MHELLGSFSVFDCRNWVYTVSGCGPNYTGHADTEGKHDNSMTDGVGLLPRLFFLVSAWAEKKE